LSTPNTGKCLGRRILQKAPVPLLLDFPWNKVHWNNGNACLLEQQFSIFLSATHLKIDIHILGKPSWEYQNFNDIKINKQKWINLTITNCHTYYLQTNSDQYEWMVKFLATDIATAGITSVSCDTWFGKCCSTTNIW
jgi:hypothetical protein